MKKLSLFLSALLISAISMAATVTMDFTSAAGLEAIGIPYPTTDAGNGAYATDLVEGNAYVQEDVAITAKYGSAATRIWLAAKGTLELRHYKTGSLTFTAPAGNVITKIVFTGSSLTGLENLNNKTWEGTAPSVDIPAAANASTIKINTITITYEASGADVVATPIIRGENNFRKTSEISIEAAAGMEVYYTLDGTDPTTASTKYAAPFTITETTTVKAIAYDGQKSSDVVEKTFVKMQILTCAEAVALCTSSTPTTEQYIIRGYVSEMIEAFNAQYGNITFWMADTKDGGQVLQAFRVKPVSEVEKGLQVGDYVEVIGSLVLYKNEIPEVNAGGSVEKITDPISGVEDIVVEKQATKFFENGQLVIMKDGIRYNAQGQVL